MADDKNDTTQMPYYPDNHEERFYLPLKQTSPLEEAFRIARLELTDIMSAVSDIVQVGRSHAGTTMDQLQEQHLELQREENLPARMAIIGGLGTLGFAIGAARGRRLKRIFYTSVGAGVGTAFCYPKQTTDTFSNLKTNITKGELPHFALDSMIDVGQISGAVQSAFETCSQLATSLINQAKSLSQTPTDESDKKTSAEKSTALTFLPATSLKPSKKFEGDPGMSKDEDKDMYTTRG